MGTGGNGRELHRPRASTRPMTHHADCGVRFGLPCGCGLADGRAALLADRPAYVATLEPLAPWSAATDLARLRRLLKSMSRTYGFRCTAIVPLVEDKAPVPLPLTWPDDRGAA